MKYLLILILHFITYTGICQQFTRFNSHDGLSKNWVRCIYQDDIGYMWFGTSGGLERFNGYEFKSYEIGQANVNAIIKYSKNEILICNDLGIYIFNIETEKIEQFPYIRYQSFLCAAKQNDDYLWIGSNLGLYRFNIKTKKVEIFNLKNDYVNTIFIDHKSNVYVGTKQGLNIFNPTTKTFVNYDHSDLKRSVSGNDITSICEDNNNHIWIGSLSGVDNMNIDSVGTFKHIHNGHIQSLLVDSKNNLWIAHSSSEGLQKLNLQTFYKNKRIEVSTYVNSLNDPKSISENSIFSLYQDNQNGLWIGTYGSGVNYVSYKEKKFNRINFLEKHFASSNLVNCIFEDEKYRWFGTEMGLLRLTIQSNTYKEFEINSKSNKGIVGVAVYCITKDSLNNLWIGTWGGGLNRYDYKSETFKHYVPSEVKGSLPSTNVYSVCESSKGNLWIGTSGGGIAKFDYKTERFISFKNNKNSALQKCGNFINYIIRLNDGSIAISEYYCVDIFNEKKNTFSRTLVNTETKKLSNVVDYLFQDSKNHIWIGSNEGLMYIKNDGKSFAQISTENGLINNTVNGIIEDSHNNLWITTNKGVSKLCGGSNIPETPSFINFTYDDGLVSSECNQRSVYKNKEGIFYIGSSNGITYFYPDSININTEIPKTAITEVQILNNLPNKNALYIPISENVNNGRTINIDYKNSNFIIKFAALNYFNTHKNSYKYMLEGYDTMWINLGNQRTITYTNIEPGNYTFKVISSNNDGVWNNSAQTLKIEILPPWWRTITFKLFGISIITLILILFYRIRISIVQKQKKMLETTVTSRTKALNAMNAILRENREEIKSQNHELFQHRHNLEVLVAERTSELEIAKKKAEENDHLKTAFLQNISHEIRTPMNAIIGFSNLLKQRDIDEEEQNQFVDIINMSSNQLLSIINDIINIATIESGQAKVNESNVNLNTVMRLFYEQFKFKANSKKIDFTYKLGLEDNDALVVLDETKFLEIHSNLINNAIKFTEKGSVEYGYEIKGKYLLFYVNDTGIGIHADNHEKIFERFRQAESTIASRFGGTGLGLSISKAYVELLGGHIWLKSTPDVGTSFYFTLPYKKVKRQSPLSKLNNIQSKEPEKHKGHILIAEDEDFNFRYLEKLLLSMHFTVERALNGLEAVEKCKRNKSFNLVFMDIKMPELDGYEATKLIRESNPTIPIIAQTAYALEKDKIKAIDAGMNDYLTKPIDKISIIEIIEKYIDKV